MNGKTIMTLGALGLLVGAAMPWGEVVSFFGSQSISGLQGDGMISGALGVVLLLAGLIKTARPGQAFSPLGGVIGLVATAVVGLALSRISGLAGFDSGVMTSAGSGLYISLVGGVMTVIGGFAKTPGEASPRNLGDTQPTKTK